MLSSTNWRAIALEALEDVSVSFGLTPFVMRDVCVHGQNDIQPCCYESVRVASFFIGVDPGTVVQLKRKILGSGGEISI